MLEFDVKIHGVQLIVIRQEDNEVISFPSSGSLRIDFGCIQLCTDSLIHASEGNLIAMVLIPFLGIMPICIEVKIEHMLDSFVQGRKYFALMLSVKVVPCWMIVDSFIVKRRQRIPE